MVKQVDLIGDLRSSLGGDCVLPPERSADFDVDGLQPRAVVAPSTYEQAAELMRYAQANGLAVIPWGSGAHMHIGNVPQRYDIALSLSRLNQIVEHEPADLTVTCQAGITLSDLQQHLAQAGQLAPLSVAAGDATVGGILAANASGPARHAYGTARDFTIGLRAVTADGRLTKAGGKVVKNVAGYDLCKLYIGSLGTLGVIVEATFKLQPLPKAEDSLAFAFSSPMAACALAADAQRRGLSLRAVELLDPTAATAAGAPDPQWLLLLDLAGAPAAVDRSCREIEEMAVGGSASAARYAARLSQAARSVLAQSRLLCNGSLLPTKLPAFTQALQAVDPPPAIVAWPTVGIVYASWQDEGDAGALLERSRDAAARLGGTLLVTVCPPDLKRSIDVFGGPPASFELMRRVKQQFDPQGVLSPGRFLGKL